VEKDSWFGFALMVPAKKSPLARRAFVGGRVSDDRPMRLSQKERYLLSSTSKIKEERRSDPQDEVTV
jgi:hypothetical protein